MNIEKQIIDALKSIDLPPNLTLVLADRSGVEPKAPYLLIQTVSDWTNSLSRNTHSHSATTATERIYQTEFHNFSFTLHDSTNGTAHDWFKRFHRGLNSDFYQYAFEQQGLGIKDFDTILYQPSPIDGVNYIISECELINHTNKGKKNESTTTVFKGLVVSFDSNKQIYHSTQS